MRKINAMDTAERERIAAVFKTAMLGAAAIFDENAFRKPRTNERKKPISKALFETWSIGLARCSKAELTMLSRRRKKVSNQFNELLAQDHEFNLAISYSTATPKRVNKRFRAVHDLIRRCLA